MSYTISISTCVLLQLASLPLCLKSSDLYLPEVRYFAIR